MQKLKVMTVVGTRPEIIRLSVLIGKLDKSEAIDHILVHTGQNYDYELNEIFFKDLELRRPDYFLDAAASTTMETIGNVLIKIDALMAEVEPDAFLILGDTNSCLCAIAAKKRHIPIFHMEAGNRCFDQRVPEENNRKIIDHISDINLTYSDIAREYLIGEGFPADRIIKTGSPMLEVLEARRKSIEASDIVERLNLEEDHYFVVSVHREENVNNEGNFLDIINSLNAVAEEYSFPMMVSTHPRTRKMIDTKGVKFNPLISLLKPLGFSDYVKLQMKAKSTLSDSGTISEEASILGFKAINLRQAHERPEAMEEGTVIMAGLRKERILQALDVLRLRREGDFVTPADYLKHNVSDKVLSIILSYTDYVKSVVWRK